MPPEETPAMTSDTLPSLDDDTGRLARRNARVLMVAQALGGASPPIVVSLGGLIGQMMMPGSPLVTLPISLFNLGVAAGALPAAFVMRRFGRRNGYLVGALIGSAAGLIAAAGIALNLFWLFCLGTATAGAYGSYVQSYRFAATDSAPPALRGRAISLVMIGGLFSAVIGPQLVILTRDTMPAQPFVGSFLSQSILALLALPVLALLRAPPVAARPAGGHGGRPLLRILLTPRFMLALAAGIVSYGLMTFLMTAAPIAMVGCGHTVGEAALGIQWHVLAMFAPSFVTGRLIARFGKERVTAAGLVIIAASAAVALYGVGLAEFWVSLVLLGLGWNFGFIGATAMISDCHDEHERARVQGANDFLLFGSVAAASFLSGSLLHSGGWASLNAATFPIIALVLVPLLLAAARSGKRRAAA